MSEDQTNSENQVVVIDGSISAENVLFCEGYEDVPLIAEPYSIDDSGKTQEQILAECGVTKEELDNAFPPNYEPLKIHPSEMKAEELLQLAKEASERLKARKQARNEESAPMPSIDAINNQYAESAPEYLKMVSDGPEIAFEEFLALLENSKAQAFIIKENETIKQAKQEVLNEVKNTLKDLIETSEMENFNAAAARKLYLDKIKVHSRLPELLKYIRSCALQGRSEVHVNYLGQYDRIKLVELGFTFTNKSTGSVLAYVVSWDGKGQ